jgi:hypothetical protein
MSSTEDKAEIAGAVIAVVVVLSFWVGVVFVAAHFISKWW